MITGQQLANAAIDALNKGITYQQEDCQAFVKNSFKRAGGSMGNFAGSNDMMRNAMTKLYQLKGAPLQPGWLVYIIEPGHNSKYQDNLGDAVHVGIYTGSPEVVHSSASRGGVFASTLKNAWTHAGPPKAARFDSTQGNEYSGQGGKLDMDDAGIKQLYRVTMPSGKEGQTVNFRPQPDSGSVVYAKLPDGTVLMGSESVNKNGAIWRKVNHEGVNGYVDASFLQVANSTDSAPYFPMQPDASYIPIPQPISNEDWCVKQIQNILKVTGIKEV